MRTASAALLDRYYPRGDDGVRFRNGTRPLYEWLLSGVDSRATVLNVGAGPTPPEPTRRMRGRVGWLIGIDPDPTVLRNEDLDEAHVIVEGRFPLASESVDAAYADWTLEHVDRPHLFLAEVHRVLKPGACFWFRTSNLLHYAGLAAAVTPHRFHMLVANRARSLDSKAHEPWPTHYRMNRPRTLTRQLTSAGFLPPEIRMVEGEPAYLMFNSAAFRIGVAYERMVNASETLSWLRHHIIGRAQRD